MNEVFIYTIFFNFSMDYLLTCKVYIDVGGIKSYTIAKACGLSPRTGGQAMV